ncbi:LtrC [Oenococcus sicerae]|uniref:LtrC n=1 Tax=Oenococcus sicerae TaxID=2203724 RepID=UPI00265A6151|nr:LtrC [Oenococcus sicerae]
MSDKKIAPILTHHKTNSLQEKHVQIAGTNDFDDRSDIVATNKTPKQSTKVTTTQRITFVTKEKIKLLAYFIDGTNDKQKLAFNDTVELLADLYVKNNLNDRQRELFKDMLEEKRI